MHKKSPFGNVIAGQPISILNASEITKKIIYSNYITKNKPLIIKDGCKDWLAMETWNQEGLTKRLKEDGLEGLYLSEDGLPFMQNFLLTNKR